MNSFTFKLSTLLAAMALTSGAAFAQATAPAASPATAPAAAPPLASSPAKKELVAKLLKLQQPDIESLARQLTEQPAAQMLNQAGLAMQSRVAPEKREAMAKEIGADVKKYADESIPLVRDRAIRLAPATVGKVLEDRFTEDELKQVVAVLESPAYAKYMQLSGAMENALLEKLVAETRPMIEPKIKALEASIGKRLGVAPPAAKPAAPAK